jgi:hypothetical protein
MFLTEPIVLVLSLLSGFSDALIFMFIQSFALVYAQWDFPSYAIGLAFVSIGIGYTIAWISFIPAIKRNEKERKNKPGDERAQYESRLWWLLFTAPCLPIGLIGFAWTSTGPPLPWIASMIFAAIVGIANYAIYMATIDYMYVSPPRINHFSSLTRASGSAPTAPTPPPQQVATAGLVTSSPVSSRSPQRLSSKIFPTPQTPTTSPTLPPSSSPSPLCLLWLFMSSTGKVRCYESAVLSPRNSLETGNKTVAEGSAPCLGCMVRDIIRLPREARRRDREGEVLYGVRAIRVSRGCRGSTRVRRTSDQRLWKRSELAS